MTHAANVHLSGRPALLRALARPKVLALACIGVLAAAGWGYLGLLIAGQSSDGILWALCRPIYGVSGTTSAASFLLTFAMWCAMALAMMLPTAGPMIMTYADLAETAAAKGEPVVSPLVLAAGYTVVWLGAAAAFATGQGVLARLSAFDDLLAVASPPFAGALFVVAGLYQFSVMKRACLTQCQHPFTFFFANWTAEPRGVFRLGLRQGVFCLGCCWAMMLLMFAIGIMSVVWMAFLGAVMAIEKISTTMRVAYAIGVAFLVIGVAILGASAAAHWQHIGWISGVTGAG